MRITKWDFILPLLALFITFLASALKPAFAAPIALASVILIVLYFVFSRN